STHVPLFLRDDAAPAGTGYFPGTSTQNLVSNVDVAPTIYQLTGVAPPQPLDGASLLEGHDDGVLLASLAQSPTSAPGYCGVVTPDGWKYVVYVPQPGVIDAPYEQELYQVLDDPFELHDRAQDTADLGAMHAELRAKRLLLATSGGRRWCDLPGVPG